MGTGPGADAVKELSRGVVTFQIWRRGVVDGRGGRWHEGAGRGRCGAAQRRRTVAEDGLRVGGRGPASAGDEGGEAMGLGWE